MTGERLSWYRLASHLKRPVGELKNQLTYKEFLEWTWFLDWDEWQRHSKADYYLAQVAMYVKKSMVKTPSSVKLDDLLIKFKRHQSSSASPEERIAASKSAWLGHLGIKA